MTPVIRVEPDGTRVYSNHTRYKPRADEDRKNFVRKPQDPRAVRWHGTWLLPLVVLPDDERVVPETRPDTDAYDHMSKPRRCKCLVCQRPEAKRWRALWRKEQRQMRMDPSDSTTSTSV